MTATRSLRRRSVFSNGTFIKLASWSVSLGLFALLAVGLARVPLFEYFRDQRDLLTRDVSIIAIAARSPITLLLLALGGLLCMGTYRWQRGEADRYSPLALLSLWIASVGGAAFLQVSMELASSGSDLYPWELLRLSRLVLIVGGTAGLVTLLKLVISRSEERGRAIALCVCCWCGGWLWIQQVLLVSPPVFTVAPASIELPTVGLAMTAKYRGDPIYTVAVEADGSICVDGEQLVDTKEATLTSALVQLAQRMPVHEPSGEADGLLTIAADARAPFGSVATALSACSSERVRIWKIEFLVQRELLELPSGRESSVRLYFPQLRPGQVPPQLHDRDYSLAGRRSHVKIRRATSAEGSSTLEYELAGELFADPRELLTALMEQREGGVFPTLRISAPSELPWQAAMGVFDGLNTDGDDYLIWEVGSFGLLD